MVMTFKMAEKTLKAKKMKDNAVSLTCGKCGRAYWATTAYGNMVKTHPEENTCGGCDGSHNDHDYPAEVENEDEERRHGISGDDIDEAEYKWGDR